MRCANKTSDDNNSVMSSSILFVTRITKPRMNSTCHTNVLMVVSLSGDTVGLTQIVLGYKLNKSNI